MHPLDQSLDASARYIRAESSVPQQVAEKIAVAPGQGMLSVSAFAAKVGQGEAASSSVGSTREERRDAEQDVVVDVIGFVGKRKSGGKGRKIEPKKRQKLSAVKVAPSDRGITKFFRSCRAGA